MNLTYAHITEGMDGEQIADFDFALKQPPGMSHIRRTKGVSALLGIMGGPPGPRGGKKP